MSEIQLLFLLVSNHKAACIIIYYDRARFLLPFKYRRSAQSGGGVAEWFRVLDFKSKGPWFKSYTLLLAGFVLSSHVVNKHVGKGKKNEKWTDLNSYKWD